MKIQLDTTNKTIKVEESVNLQELTDALEKLLPNGEWKQFKLETNTIITNWGAPIVIRERSWPYWWNSPWYSTGNTFISTNGSDLQHQQYYTSNNGDNPGLNQGVYNIEA